MIVTISGDLGSGKSSVCKAINKEFGMKHFSVGDFVREMAAKRGMSLMELSKQAEKDPTIDKEIDRMTEELGKKEDNILIDTRIGFHFIPHSIKVYLKTTPEKAAERIWRDIKEGKRNSEKEHQSYQDVLNAIKRRKKSEQERYLKYYQVDNQNMKNYDFVLDATNLTVDEEVNAVLDFLKTKIKL